MQNHTLCVVQLSTARTGPSVYLEAVLRGRGGAGGGDCCSFQGEFSHAHTRARAHTPHTDACATELETRLASLSTG